MIALKVTALGAAAMLMASTVFGQENDLGTATETETQAATAANGAEIRLLDRVTGQLEDVEMFVGQTARVGPIDVDLQECRYPTGNPSGDAYAYLEIEDRTAQEQIFSGWMIASSPALNALDHPRYDVWVIRCKLS